MNLRKKVLFRPRNKSDFFSTVSNHATPALPDPTHELLVRRRVLLDVGVHGLVRQLTVGGADDVRAGGLPESDNGEIIATVSKTRFCLNSTLPYSCSAKVKNFKLLGRWYPLAQWLAERLFKEGATRSANHCADDTTGHSIFKSHLSCGIPMTATSATPSRPRNKSSSSAGGTLR